MKKSKNFKFKYTVVLTGILFVSMLIFFLPESFARTWTDNDGTVYTTVPRDCLALDAQGNNKGLYAVYSDGTIMPAEGPIDHGPHAAGGSAPCYYQDQLGLWAGKWGIWGIFDETLTGYVYAPVTGTYKFLLSADDQAWLTFNGAPLITTPYCAHAIANIDLTGGTWYPIQIKYQNRCGSNWFGFLWHLSPKLVVKAKDGVDFSTGSTILNNPETLVSGGKEVKTAVADGVTRLVLMLNVSEQGTADFSVDNAAAGALSSLSNQSNTSTSISSIPSVSTSQGQKIFVVYKVPDNFVSDSHDAYLSEREITIHVKFHPASGGETTTEQKIKLVRPPVLLLHGFGSDYPRCFVSSGFTQNLLQNINGLKIIAFSYPIDTSIYSNYVLVGNAVKSFIYLERRHGIAISKVDVITHSLGGVLSRLFVQAGNQFYRHRENYYEGYINKLITIDSPHKGAVVADFAQETYWDLMRSLNPYKTITAECINATFKAVTGSHVYAPVITESGYKNLTKNYPLLTGQRVYGHTICGDMLYNTPDYLTMSLYGGLYSLLVVSAGITPPPELWPVDGLVELPSQQSTMIGRGTDTFFHFHTAAGFGITGSLQNPYVQQLSIYLLNTDPKGVDFDDFL